MREIGCFWYVLAGVIILATTVQEFLRGLM